MISRSQRTNRSPRLVLLLVVAMLGLRVVGLPLVSSEATVVKPLTLSYDKVVYGDFTVVGNGVLRCPKVGEFSASAATAAKCLAAQLQGTTLDGNNNYTMVNTDIDSDPATFNSSSARLTLPPGSTVDFARLNWAGDTGRYNNNGTLEAAKSCGSGSSTSNTQPAGSALTQKPRLKVGTAASADITPAAITSDGASTTKGAEEFYSGYADVTSAFTNAPTGAPLDITVGNVWTVNGQNCFGGWSLALVWKFPQVTEPYAPSKKTVFMFDGHVRQSANDPQLDTTISGFRAISSTSRIGLTAYEGDRHLTGDQLLINDTAADETSGSGSSTNYFVSHADGQLNPDGVTNFNNFNVDAKTSTSNLIKSGSTSAKISLKTSGDAYLLQNLVVSLAVPELSITKSVLPAQVHPGDTATWTITVKNPTSSEISNVAVDDAVIPACARKSGSAGWNTTLAGNETRTYTCTSTAPNDDVVNSASVSGKNGLGETLSGTAVATLDVLNPAVKITKTAIPTVVRVGDRVTYEIVVTNTGNAPLKGVTVTDSTLPLCSKVLTGQIEAGESVTYSCSTLPVVTDTTKPTTITNTVTVNAADNLGRKVSANDGADVKIITSGITFTKKVKKDSYRPGDDVEFVLKVTNTGNSTITGVKVADPSVPACEKEIGDLAAGASTEWSCKTKAGDNDFTNTATVTSTDESKAGVDATSSADVNVIHPGIDISKTVDLGTVRQGEQVLYTVTVKNTGDSTLKGVKVSDPTSPLCDNHEIGDLKAGKSVTYTCTYVVGGLDDVASSATATGTDATGISVSDTDGVTVSVIHPAILIKKAATPSIVREGQQVTYSIAVVNTGDVPLTDVKIDDPQITDCSRSLAKLLPLESTAFLCTAKAGKDDITNTATVTAKSPRGADVTSSAKASVDVVHPSIAVDKAVDHPVAHEGDVLTYTVTVTNNGDTPLTAVTVTDPIYPTCTRVIPLLAAGATTSFTCAGLAGADDLSSTITAAGTSTDGSVVTKAGSVDINVIHPLISITESVDKPLYREGDTVELSFTVRNVGDVPLHNVKVSDPRFPDCDTTIDEIAAGKTADVITCQVKAPVADTVSQVKVNALDPIGLLLGDVAQAVINVIHPALTLIKTADTAIIQAGQTLTFHMEVVNSGDSVLKDVKVTDPTAENCTKTIGELAAGASSKYDCTFQAPLLALSTTNVATATGLPPVGVAVSNVASVTVGIQNPGITITKVTKDPLARPGDTVTFEVTVTNTGDTDLTGVVVDDPIFDGCNKAIGDLAQGASVTYTCTVKAPSDDVVGNVVVTGTPPNGPVVKDTGSSAIDVIHPKLTITKDAPTGPVLFGQQVDFTIKVSNNGDVDLSNVKVIDPLATSCERTFDTIKAHSSETFVCSMSALDDDFTNFADAEGKDPSGHTVTTVNGGLGTIPGIPGLPGSSTGGTGLPGGGDSGIPGIPGASTLIDVIHPGIGIVVSGQPAKVHLGEPISWVVTVTNTGDVPLTNGSISDLLVGSCERDLPATFAVGEVLTYTCTSTAGSGPEINTGIVTALNPLGLPVGAISTAVVQVVNPHIEVTTSGPDFPVLPGAPVDITVTVHNNGDVALNNVTIDNPLEECKRTGLDLAAGDTLTYVCTTTAPDKSTLIQTVAKGIDIIDRLVDSTSDVPVIVVHPGLELKKEAKNATVREGEPLTFVIQAINSGDTDLINVDVTDETIPECSQTIPRIAYGTIATYECTITAPEVKDGDSQSFTNKAVGRAQAARCNGDDCDEPLPVAPVLVSTSEGTATVLKPEPTPTPTPTEEPTQEPTNEPTETPQGTFGPINTPSPEPTEPTQAPNSTASSTPGGGGGATSTPTASPSGPKPPQVSPVVVTQNPHAPSLTVLAHTTTSGPSKTPTNVGGLPFTGDSTAQTAAIALLAMVAGAWLVTVSGLRRREEQ